MNIVYMKTHKKIILILFFIFFVYCNSYSEGFQNEKTFSNTMKWGNLEKDFLKFINKRNLNIFKKVSKPPFYKNNSEQTRRELQSLVNMQQKVTEEQRSNIMTQRNFDKTLEYFKLEDDDSAALQKYIEDTVKPVHMYLKRHFNRVRPSLLDSRIRPIITVPPHASYPSGHATEAWSIAYALGDKFPEQKDTYYGIAHDIATNRERAGVHYKSDSEYGQKLAKEILNLNGKKYHPLTGSISVFSLDR